MPETMTPSEAQEAAPDGKKPIENAPTHPALGGNDKARELARDLARAADGETLVEPTLPPFSGFGKPSTKEDPLALHLPKSPGEAGVSETIQPLANDGVLSPVDLASFPAQLAPVVQELVALIPDNLHLKIGSWEQPQASGKGIEVIPFFVEKDGKFEKIGEDQFQALISKLSNKDKNSITLAHKNLAQAAQEYVNSMQISTRPAPAENKGESKGILGQVRSWWNRLRGK
ncbi:hypothetical protein HYW32_00055 [Candidatus Berkelbacteria bacterium]|nr:hypothetical protein [Candidatus Berkelbacteria bacterium]